MSRFSQFRTIVCSPDAEAVLRDEIEKNERLALIYDRLEWMLSRNPYRGMKLDYPDYDFWLYELIPNRDDLPKLQAVYSIEKNKIVIQFLNVDYTE